MRGMSPTSGFVAGHFFVRRFWLVVENRWKISGCDVTPSKVPTSLLLSFSFPGKPSLILILIPLYIRDGFVRGLALNDSGFAWYYKR